MKIKCYGLDCFKCEDSHGEKLWSFSYVIYKQEIEFVRGENSYTIGCDESKYERYVLYPDSVARNHEKGALSTSEKRFVMHSIEISFQLFGVSYVLFAPRSDDGMNDSDRYLIPVNRLPENRPCVHIGWFCRYVTLDEAYENGSEAVS